MALRGYLHRIEMALEKGVIHASPGTIHETYIEHDGNCDIYHNAQCTCVPIINIINSDGSILAIDEHGNGRKVSKQ